MSGPTGSITAGVASLIADTPRSAVPPAALEAARRHVLDTFGVTLAGSAEPVVAAALDVLAHPPSAGGAALVGLGRWAGPVDAALVNAVSAHAIDYDDVHSHVRGHPSACVLPAALAAAEQAGLDGAGLLDAYVVGVEVAGRVGRGFDASHARQGFHSTSTLGVLGAVAAAARAFGLTAGQTAHALGIAASSAGGLRSNFGTMTKPLHAGFAARDGVAAALLARRGVTATETVLDGPGSFTRVYCPDGGEPDAALGPDGPWEILVPGIAIKKYPCCNRGHRTADAVLDLVRNLDLRADDIAEVRVRMPAGQVDGAGRVGPMTFPRPASGLEAKFSMQYVVAAAVLHRALPMAAFTDEGVRDRRIAGLIGRVRPVNRPDGDDRVEVVITERSGAVHARSVRFTRGDPRGGAPLPWDELLVKYRDCAVPVLGEDATARSAALVERLPALPDLRELTGLLAGTTAG
ncbi:MmgE/PrpD family protein [Actinomadura syzygii]|uniref:MmgE/PrpD family protein n=1 Tax=Actinomadura syzygii TaxID=1427538 RepID=A0A5D0U5G4_9ACTN|nr:MmgE/PrpD family protein [Actinomadura syzygii]TYC13194.1 MmgE/PrpD family protein [Actinomadura syzygii]